ATARGERFQVGVWTGASTAPELDGALASVDGIDLRMPYQSDPVSRAKINAGHMDYLDVHLSHVAQMVWQGYFGHLGIALVEVAGITDDGDLIPSSSVGNNKTWIDQAERVILEVNSWQPIELEGMHDIYYGTALPPDRKPIQIVRPADRIGVPYFRCPPEKIVAIVPTHSPDRNSPFKPPDTVSGLIADWRHRIILRPQEISNHPEVIRRLGCLAMNGMIEADIYGNVNSTHLMGSSIQNGIGGSGDFARNAYISMFVTPSTAKGGLISCIVPMASH